ncbi:MAG: hypothetical protein IJM30_00945 [Thermoguttaceae bacterium]|nr:hypothetical protein [Thermoguttaceae bacterium]MBQ9873012.1 hypothetical protein [Thermoguttaceae bacterium]
MDKKTIGFAVGILAITGAAIYGILTYANSGRSGSNSSEVAFLKKLADSNNDGVVSAEEEALFAKKREEMSKSNGELTFSLETGELEIADKIGHDPEALAKIAERAHMKDAAVSRSDAALREESGQGSAPSEDSSGE